MDEFSPQLHADSYDRPQQPWLCGRMKDGIPCALGPGPRGECLTTAACQPLLQNGTWVCNRSPSLGGKCDGGPTAAGQCVCPLPRCSPQRSMRSHRARWVWACFMATAALIALTMSSAWRDEVIAPGPLSDSHAQLIRDKTMQRCGSCHEAGNSGLADWSLMMIGAGRVARKSQSELCMECHQAHVTDKFALRAHSWDQTRLAQKTNRARGAAGLSGGTVSTGRAELDQLACARCHQEHHGGKHDLTQSTGGQCNTCHVRKFASFASHADFGTWPNERRTRIIFDHRSHEFKHFPESKQAYRCAACHAPDESGEPMRTVHFQACAGCHDDDIQRSLDTPVALVQLPIIDTEVLRREGLSVGEWPGGFTGDFDGAIPPLLQLMLWADPSAQVALRHFGPQFDFLDVDTGNFDDLEAASELVWGIKLFLYELSVDGPAAIMRRAQKLNEGALRDEDSQKFAIGLDARQVAGVVNAHFKNLRTDLADRLLAGDLADHLDPPCRVSESPHVHWSYDASACDISLRVEGHANPLLTGWLELATRLGPEESKLRPPLLSATGPGQCFSCHSLDVGAGLAALRANWLSGRPQSSLSRPFTRFAHAPHLLQPGITDCRDCHIVDKTADYLGSYASTNLWSDQWNFQPMDQAACAACHTAGGAGDHCTQCHNYHVR